MKATPARICLVLLCAGLLLAGCSGTGSGDQAAGDETRIVTGSGTVTTIPPGERKPAPDLAGESLDGKPIALSDYEGKVVVLNVWGSWCAPCRKEAPHLVAASESLAPRGVVFLGINTRDGTVEPAQAFERTYDIPYPSVFDPDGDLLLGFRESLPPSAIPSTLVIDQEGRVAARVLGTVTRTTLEQLALDVVGIG